MQSCVWHGREPILADRLSAPLADSVGTRVDLLERVVDVAEGLPERADERVDLASLGRDLARVGEALVEGPAIDPHRRELGRQAVALGGQGLAVAGRGGIRHGEMVSPEPL
jgi:hypothetical protein